MHQRVVEVEEERLSCVYAALHEGLAACQELTVDVASYVEIKLFDRSRSPLRASSMLLVPSRLGSYQGSVDYSDSTHVRGDPYHSSKP
jgi:hypothetical protein